MRFADRRTAGRVLATALVGRLGADALVLGLPRGGVVVAAEVATTLHAQLDVLVVRKLGVPGHPERAMGAIAAVGEPLNTVWVDSVLDQPPLDRAAVAAVCERELAELRRRIVAYRGQRPPPAVAGRHVVLIDDGLATGATMRVAVHAVRAGAPARLTVAVPVGPPRVVTELSGEVDELVCPSVPPAFRGVGQAYADFPETEDDQVRDALG